MCALAATHESLRQDALIRAQAPRERMVMAVPVAIIILCIVCATITGMFTKSAVFAVAFLVVAIAVIMALYFTRKETTSTSRAIRTRMK